MIPFLCWVAKLLEPYIYSSRPVLARVRRRCQVLISVVGVNTAGLAKSKVLNFAISSQIASRFIKKYDPDKLSYEQLKHTQSFGKKVEEQFNIDSKRTTVSGLEIVDICVGDGEEAKLGNKIQVDIQDFQLMEQNLIVVIEEVLLNFLWVQEW